MRLIHLEPLPGPGPIRPIEPSPDWPLKILGF